MSTHRVTAFDPPDRPVEGNTINVREATPTPAALAGAEAHLRTLTDRYSAFAGSVLGQSAALVLAELDRLRAQRDAVLALHQRDGTRVFFGPTMIPICRCQANWPCDTARALGVSE